jgi:ankyrin repeat protein
MGFTNGSLGDSCSVSQDGKTALMRAAEKGHAEVARLLLAAGADARVQNKVSVDYGGFTVLSLGLKFVLHAFLPAVRKGKLRWTPRPRKA